MAEQLSTTPVVDVRPETPMTDVSPVPTATNQFLQVKNNEQLDREAAAREQEKRLTTSPQIQDLLAQYIDDRYVEARNAKRTVTDKILDNRRRRKGTYSASRLAEIKKQGGSEVFMLITEVKCNNAEAWISDVVLPTQGKSWRLEPTPRPNLPSDAITQIIEGTIQRFIGGPTTVPDQEVIDFARQLRDEVDSKMMKDARRRADKMADVIGDQFVEGGYEAAMDECISDVVCDGTMIMKGPFVQSTTRLQWLDDDWQPDITQVPQLRFKRVDPLKFFPSPGATGTSQSEATYLIELDEFTRKSLADMKGLEGWNTAKINAVIKDNPDGTTVPIETRSEERTLEDRTASGNTNNPDRKYQGKWYTGAIPGYLLQQWGLRGLDVTDDYEAVALVLDGMVVHARLSADPLGRRNYSRAVYKPVIGSFWGKGVPELMADVQDNCNAIARHLINNMAIGSGPQVVVHDVDALAEGEEIQSLYPWRIWQFTDPTGARKGSPVTFTQPDIKAAELMTVYERFLEMADERTGIPRSFAGSTEATGAATTSTGLSILMNAAARVLKKSISFIDKNVTRPMVQRTFAWNMMFVDDNAIKGDAQVVATGAMGLFVKEQEQLRLQEFLNATNNPTDLAIIGTKRRAAALRALAENLGSAAAEELVPTDSELTAAARVTEGATGVAAEPGAPEVVGEPTATSPGGVVAPGGREVVEGGAPLPVAV